MPLGHHSSGSTPKPVTPDESEGIAREHLDEIAPDWVHEPRVVTFKERTIGDDLHVYKFDVSGWTANIVVSAIGQGVLLSGLRDAGSTGEGIHTAFEWSSAGQLACTDAASVSLDGEPGFGGAYTCGGIPDPPPPDGAERALGFVLGLNVVAELASRGPVRGFVYTHTKIHVPECRRDWAEYIVILTQLPKK